MNIKQISSKVLKVLNSAKSLTVEEQQKAQNRNDEPSVFFGFYPVNITFTGVSDIQIYEETVKQYYELNGELCETISFASFQDDFLNYLRYLKESKHSPSQKELQEIIDENLKKELVQSEIMYDLHGVELDEERVELGDFVIYNLEKAKDKIRQAQDGHISEELFFKQFNSKVVVSIKVVARDNIKAYEIADNHITYFENVVTFLLGDLKKLTSVGVFNIRMWKSTSRLQINDNGTTSYSGKSDVIIPVNLKSIKKATESKNSKNIWELKTKKDKSEIEKRLVQAINWIGMALKEREDSLSLVLLVMSIESMLMYNEGQMITPSIANQLSEWLAFIIQDNPKGRNEIAKYFKNIYGKRSAIVHGGNKSINKEDMSIALYMAKSMVFSFLKFKPFSKLNTMKELGQCVTELKYK